MSRPIGIKFEVTMNSEQISKQIVGFENLSQTSQDKLSRKMAERCAKRVRDVIIKLPNHGYKSRGHNTPTSLTETVGLRKHPSGIGKKEKGYYVYMRRLGSRGINPEWVEYGTSQSDKSSRGPNDKGSVSSRPFDKGKGVFKAKDIPMFEKLLSDGIKENWKKAGFKAIS